MNHYQDRSAQLGAVIKPITMRHVYSLAAIGGALGAAVYYMSPGTRARATVKELGKVAVYGALPGAVIATLLSGGARQWQRS
jgi:hypothetical protein